MDKIIEASNNKTYALFRGLCKDVPNWSDFIENFDYNYNRDKNKPKNTTDPKHLTDNILAYNKFDPIVFGAIEGKASPMFDKSLEASVAIEALIKKKASSIKSIMNFLGNEQEPSSAQVVDSRNSDRPVNQRNGEVAEPDIDALTNIGLTQGGRVDVRV